MNLTPSEKRADTVQAIGLGMWASFTPLAWLDIILNMTWLLKLAVVFLPLGLIILFAGVLMSPSKETIEKEKAEM